MKNIVLEIFVILSLLGISCESFNEPSPNYIYQIPSTDGEFQTSSLISEGINEKLITQLTNSIIREEFKRIDGVIIMKNNKLVYEEYFHGYDKETLHNIYSSTKSITAILVGLAIENGFIGSIETPILDLLPEYVNIRNLDERKRQITIKNLLNMTSGLDCEDWLGGTESIMNQSNDWVKFTLDLPMKDTPGEFGSYCTGGVVTLGRIIENQSGMRIDEFANEYLFKPLGINKYQWEIMPDGRLSAGGKLFLRPRDMAKIGLLMVNEGEWEGKQIISKSWIEACLKIQAQLLSFDGYGYLWWKQKFGDPYLDVIFSSGNGGQDIFTVPSEKMVVVFTAGNANTSLGIQSIFMIRDFIFPAITR